MGPHQRLHGPPEIVESLPELSKSGHRAPLALPANVSHAALSRSKYQKRCRARRLRLLNAISRAAGKCSTERDDHQDTHLLISQIRRLETAGLWLCPDVSRYRVHLTNDRRGRRSTCKCWHPGDRKAFRPYCPPIARQIAFYFAFAFSPARPANGLGRLLRAVVPSARSFRFLRRLRLIVQQFLYKTAVFISPSAPRLLRKLRLPIGL